MESRKVTEKRTVEELAFKRAVTKGLVDLKEGREMSLADVKRRFRVT